jgi:hypothetical protein
MVQRTRFSNTSKQARSLKKFEEPELADDFKELSANSG